MKGQASLEYLMNYGWAILILLFVLSAILLSGAFSPGSFFKEYCISPPQLKCLSIQGHYGEDILLGFKFSNEFGFPIKIVSAKLQFQGEEFNKDVDKVVKQGEDISLIYRVPRDLSPPGTFRDFSINITYIVCEKDINPDCKPIQSLTGNMAVKGFIYISQG